MAPQIKATMPEGVWVQCFDIKEGENLAIFAGDSEGSMLTFRAPENWRNDCIFELARKFP